MKEVLSKEKKNRSEVKEETRRKETLQEDWMKDSLKEARRKSALKEVRRKDKMQLKREIWLRSNPQKCRALIISESRIKDFET